MIRVFWSLGLASLAFCTLFAIGCATEPGEPSEPIWYDSDDAACYTEDEDGSRVEVPCNNTAEPVYEALSVVQGCDLPDTCTNKPKPTTP